MKKDDILKYIKNGENEYIEFKEKFSDEVIRALCAFSNYKGGIVIIGISDKGEIKGINLGKESIQKWLTEIKNKTSPYITPEISIFEIENKKVVAFEVIEFPIKPVSFKGRYYIRTKNRDHHMGLSEVAEMYLRTRNTSWDYLINENKSINDLDENKILKVMKMIEKNLEIDLDNPLSFLRKYSLIIEKNQMEFPTNASLLLFSKKPLDMTDIQIGLFQDEITIKKSKIIRNDLISEVEEVMDFIKSYILKEYIFDGKVQRTEKWQYPLMQLENLL